MPLALMAFRSAAPRPDPGLGAMASAGDADAARPIGYKFGDISRGLIKRVSAGSRTDEQTNISAASSAAPTPSPEQSASASSDAQSPAAFPALPAFADEASAATTIQSNFRGYLVCGAALVRLRAACVLPRGVHCVRGQYAEIAYCGGHCTNDCCPQARKKAGLFG